MTTGQKIKALRKQKGLTQEELAHMLGYKNKASVAHIETNRDLPLNMLVKIAHILGTSPAYLIGWEREPEKKKYLINSLDCLSDEQFEELISYFEELKAQNE